MISSPQIQLVHRAADHLHRHARGLPAVPTHGDAQPRNWIWDPATRQLAFIDFERAEPAPAVRDLVRLEYGPWDRRPDLREAFMSGYGRVLHEAEEEALKCFAALDALSGIQWGTANNDPEVTTRAWRTFERLSLRQ
jgi:Ser/Thr protein kinase RdoA (MazF antagonist)